MSEPARHTALIQRAASGDVEAFTGLVREYQDLAVGYGVAILGDVHAAEDAAQEAFITVFSQLDQLRDPVAFLAWLGTVVRTACSRATRKWQPATVSLDQAPEAEDPMAVADGADQAVEVMAPVRALPETERSVIALFYMSRYSHREIARFLDVPETTVQGRLRTGRQRLKERIWKMAEDHLSQHAPSRDSRFTERIKRLVRPEGLESDEEQPWAGGRGTDMWETLTAAIRGDLPTIQRLVRKDPRLATCSHQYRTPLHFAVQENHLDVVRFLLDQGVDATYRSGNFWHERPVTIAEERGYRELHQLLQDHLARTAGGAEGGECIAAAIRERDLDAVGRMLDAEPGLISAGDARGPWLRPGSQRGRRQAGAVRTRARQSTAAPYSVFTDSIRAGFNEGGPDQERYLKQLEQIDRLGALVEPDEMARTALQYVISHPVNPVATPGAKSPEQAAMNAAAGDDELSGEELERLRM